MRQISALIVTFTLAITGVQAQIKIGVVTSSSGPIAMVGISQRNTVALLPKEISGHAMTYISLDDRSDPTATVVAIRKLIDDEGVNAIIGPSGSPNAIGAIPFVAASSTPLLAPVGTEAVVLPMTEQKKWVFKTTPNDNVICRVLVDHMVAAGIKTVGFIGAADSYGENWLKVFSGMAQTAGIDLVSSEAFRRGDASVIAQILKTLLAKPEAVLIAAPGGAAALPHMTLFDQGYRGKIYQTHGAAFDDFIRVGGRKVEGSIVAASGFVVLESLSDTNPIKAVGSRYIADYQALYNAKPAMFGSNVYDAGLLLQAAIPHALGQARPGTIEFRTALRDALETSTNVVASQGIYSMSAHDHSGLDGRAVELITIRDGQWVPLK